MVAAVGVADGGRAVAAIPELPSLGLGTAGPGPVARGRGVLSRRASNAPGGSEEGHVQRGRSMRGTEDVEAGTRNPRLSRVMEEGTRRRGGKSQRARRRKVRLRPILLLRRGWTEDGRDRTPKAYRPPKESYQP